MIRPPDMPYDVYKAVRSDLNKKLKERKKGKLVFASRKKVDVVDPKTGLTRQITVSQTAKRKTK